MATNTDFYKVLQDRIKELEALADAETTNKKTYFEQSQVDFRNDWLQIPEVKERISREMQRIREDKMVAEFMAAHKPMDFGANMVGVGLGRDGDMTVGLNIGFPTQEALNAFPFKEATFQGVPVRTEVIGVIVPL